MCRQCGCDAPIRQWPVYGGIKVCPNCDAEYIEKAVRTNKSNKPKRGKEVHYESTDARY
jgi:hypothetical protein